MFVGWLWLWFGAMRHPGCSACYLLVGWLFRMAVVLLVASGFECLCYLGVLIVLAIVVL